MQLFLETSTYKEDSKEGKQIHFLLCESCFWCASLLRSNDVNNNDNIISKYCPSCSNNRVQSMPVSCNEVYKFDYNPKRGLTLKFSTVHHPSG
jgi:hypothetical protein